MANKAIKKEAVKSATPKAKTHPKTHSHKEASVSKEEETIPVAGAVPEEHNEVPEKANVEPAETKEKTLDEELLSFVNDESRDKELSLEGIVDAVTNKTLQKRIAVEHEFLNLIADGDVLQAGHRSFSLSDKGKAKLK